MPHEEGQNVSSSATAARCDILIFPSMSQSSVSILDPHSPDSGHPFGSVWAL